MTEFTARRVSLASKVISDNCQSSRHKLLLIQEAADRNDWATIHRLIGFVIRDALEIERHTAERIEIEAN